MIEKFKVYLRESLSVWRGRWAMRGWRERLDMLLIPVAVLVGLLISLWLALWFFFGPPSVKIGDIEVELDRSVSLSGPDKDANGIRDDIDEYIRVLAKKKAYSEPQVKALQQDAKAMQRLVTVDLSDAKAVRAVANSVGRSSWCRFLRFKEAEAYQLGQQLRVVIANTKQRAVARVEFSRAMNGTVSTSPEGDSCDL